MTLTRKIAAAALAAALVATLGSISSNQAADAGEKGIEGAGPKAIAHHAGGKAIPGNNKGPTPRLYPVGMGAGEPTVGATNEGNLFFAALPGMASKVLRSSDQGATWEDVSPKLPTGQDIHRVSLDPYVHVDATEGVDRVFTIDLTVACSFMSFSDDEGESWITNPLACGRPVNNHQTLFTGPPKTSLTPLYPNLVYYCWNDVASSACSKSIDGGLTFAPTGTPAYLGVNDEATLCGGIHGHGHVDSRGNVYLPRDYCGQPYLAISRNEGLTWETVQVAKNGMPTQCGYTSCTDPSIRTDSKGNIYYLYIARNRLPHLVISRDGGKTWSMPMMVAAPGVNGSNLPSLEVSAPGKLAFVYYGTQNSPFPRCHHECTEKDWAKTTWNGYMAMSVNALSDKPVFYSTTVNDPRDPLKRQQCGPGRCGTSVYDFIDVNIAPDGQVWGSFVDACTLICGTRDGIQDAGKDGIVGRLVGGPNLR